MFKHIVMWKLREQADGAAKERDALAIKARLEGLKATLPEISHIEVGINACDSAVAYDVVLYSEFEDLDALERYRVHPDHKEAAAFVSSVTSDRAVADYPC